MRRSYALATALITAVWAIACRTGDTSSAITPPILQRTSRVTLCADDRPAECQWRLVRSVAWIENGQIAVLNGPRDIHLFSSTGEPHGALGRTGDGPGEFRFVADLRAPDATGFRALDIRHFRVEIFDTLGRTVTSIPIPIRPIASGIRLSGQSTAILEVDGADSLGAKVPAYVDFVPFDSAHRSRRVAFTARAQRLSSSEFQPAPRPFAPELLWDVNSVGELVVGYGNDQELVVFDTLGQPRTTIRGDWPAVRIPTMKRDSAAAALMKPGGRPSPSTAYTARARQLAAQLPEFLPRVQEVRLTSDGSVWLRRSIGSVDQTVWEWYDQSGQRVGALPLQSGERLVGVDRGRVALEIAGPNGQLTLRLEQISAPLEKSAQRR